MEDETLHESCEHNSSTIASLLEALGGLPVPPRSPNLPFAFSTLYALNQIIAQSGFSVRVSELLYTSP